MGTIRLLQSGDEATVERFLAPRADSSMFLRDNLQRAGLIDLGDLHHGTYAGHFDGDVLTDVAAHYWNGNVVVQAPNNVESIVRLVSQSSKRAVKGLLGPGPQVERARAVLDFNGAVVQLDAPSELFAIDLEYLKVPTALRTDVVVCRRPRRSELDILVNWTSDLMQVALGFTDSVALQRDAQRSVERAHQDGRQWVSVKNGHLVASCTYSVRMDDIVQIGGVWTPPPWRGRGFARAVVAGALLAARQAGISRAVLIASDPAAKKAYRAVGFEPVGEYSLVLLEAA